MMRPRERSEAEVLVFISIKTTVAREWLPLLTLERVESRIGDRASRLQTDCIVKVLSGGKVDSRGFEMDLSERKLKAHDEIERATKRVSSTSIATLLHAISLLVS